MPIRQTFDMIAFAMNDEICYINSHNFINPTTTESVTFHAVKVEKGRKFKGRGFIVASVNSSGAFGWRHGQYGWEPSTYDVDYAKIWVPELGKFQYANAKYVEDDDSVSQEECARQFKLYTKQTIASTIAWCESKQPEASEEQNLMFARRVLLKNHPEMKDSIEVACPDTRSMKDEVESTFKWVNSLPKKHTRPKKIEIARKSLRKKGMTEKDGFEECFTMMCELYGWLQKPKKSSCQKA